MQSRSTLMYPLEAETTITIFVKRIAFELRTLNAPLCRVCFFFLFSSLIDSCAVRPRIKKKRLCDSTSARVLSFLRLTYEA